MFNEGLQENNSVVITGEVVGECQFSHEVCGEQFYTFELASKRLSDQADILPVTISERLMVKEPVVVGSFVAIKGQLRSYNNYNNSNASRLVLTVFARDLEILPEMPEKEENLISLKGFICKNPVYRKTPFGREITDVLLAVNRAYHKSDYIPCIAWGRTARYMQHLETGANLHIEGRVQSRFYQKRIGEDTVQRVAYEVSVAKIEVIGNDKIDPEMGTTAMETGVE